jgi:hypothetical protein
MPKNTTAARARPARAIIAGNLARVLRDNANEHGTTIEHEVVRAIQGMKTDQNTGDDDHVTIVLHAFSILVLHDFVAGCQDLTEFFLDAVPGLTGKPVAPEAYDALKGGA